VANRCCDRLHCEGRCGGFEGLQEIIGICRRCRVEQEGDPVDARRNLLEQLHPPAGHRRLYKSETGDVAARPREARDEAAADRIGNGRENDGDGVRLLQQRGRGGGGVRKKNLGLQGDELLRESLPRLRVGGCRPASVDPGVAALRPPELLESLPECRDHSLCLRVVLGKAHQHTNAPHPVRLLRARSERPRHHRAAEKGDELAPPHVLLPPGEDHTLAHRRQVRRVLCITANLARRRPAWVDRGSSLSSRARQSDLRVPRMAASVGQTGMTTITNSWHTRTPPFKCTLPQVSAESSTRRRNFPVFDSREASVVSNGQEQIPSRYAATFPLTGIFGNDPLLAGESSLQTTSRLGSWPTGNEQ